MKGCISAPGVRGIGAGPKETLRTPEAADGRVQALPKLSQIIGRAVGQRLATLGPDIPRRIEFRRVGWELMNMQARVPPEERCDRTTPADRAVVLEQVDGAAQVPGQMVQKGPNVEAQVQRFPSSSGSSGSGTRHW